MKSVLISIQPKWCELIAYGKKTVEVRKTKPQQKTPFKVYIYETQGHTRYCNKCQDKGCSAYAPNAACFEGKGKVIGEFVCKHITNIEVLNKGLFTGGYPNGSCTMVVINSALTAKDIKEYANGKKIVYGWHISDLVIYDKPKEINEFVSASKLNTNCFGQHLKRLDRPPQSWCYVEGSA